MSQLPALETASFDAELPFSATSLALGSCTVQQMRETRLALRVLAAPVESTESADPLMQRMEAKLDLALEVGLLSRYPERPPLTLCRVGLDAIAWHSPQAHNVGEVVELTLFPHPDSALVLYAAARIQECQITSAGGYKLKADIRQAFSEYTLQLWEKWVFRRHRRSVMDR